MAYIDDVAEAILDQSPNGETRKELNDDALYWLARYYDHNDYAVEDLWDESDMYPRYDMLKWILDEKEALEESLQLED